MAKKNKILLSIGVVVLVASIVFRRDIMVAYHEAGLQDAMDMSVDPAFINSRDMLDDRINFHRRGLIEWGVLQRDTFQFKVTTEKMGSELNNDLAAFTGGNHQVSTSWSPVGDGRIEVRGLYPAEKEAHWLVLKHKWQKESASDASKDEKS